MKGHSTLTVTPESVIEYVQYYLETVVFAEGVCPIVTDVEVGYESGIRFFKIKLRERTEGDPE